jgi:two-component system, chemotaxis family, chemotaxis protein CheY
MSKILTVDDSEPMRKLMRFVLGAAGHHVTTASNGAEALSYIQTDSFDLVVTDINMPIMDGTQLISQIRQNDPDLPILVLTTEREQQLHAEGKAMGASGWVQKPFQPQQFNDMVHRLLN